MKNNFILQSIIFVPLFFKKMKQIFTSLALMAALPMLQAQWSKSTPTSEVVRKVDGASYYKLDINHIRTQLLNAPVQGKGFGTPVVVSIPTKSGKIEKFAVSSFPVMDKAIEDQYQLGSYVGVGIDDPSKYIRFSIAPNDFQSMIISNGKYEFIEPATADKTFYSVHGKTGKQGAFECSTKESPESVANLNEMMKNGATEKSGNKKFHTLRLAVSVTGEYGAYYGGVAGALAQINATMSRVNGVFEQEFNLHLNVVTAPNLIFTNGTTDPYSDASYMCKWNYELMNVLHGGTYGIGDADFDIGHLFGRTGGGGNAGCIGCIGSNSTATTSYTAAKSDCQVDGTGAYYAYISPNNYKGSGITSPGTGAPQGDNFDIDYVAHEMGHQLGDSHTYSFYEQYLNKEMEPGSGSTIMGYAGITGSNTDVQAHSDPYFHTASIDQVQANLTSKAVSVVTDIANNPPVVTAMSTTYTIPKSTAFVLTANATDPDGDALTYCWEQIDPSKLAGGIGKAVLSNGDGTSTTIIGNNTSGANFRSWAPTSNPTRYFPKLATVLGGAVKNTADFEATSTVAKTTNFRVTVRDNKAGGQAQTAFANQVIVVGSAAAFTVNAGSGNAGTPLNVTWVVSGTTASPYNVANVKIDYTVDNGTTWATLAESVPNNGSASVTFPSNLGGSTPIVRVSAIGNVFYAVNKITLGSLAVSDINKAGVQVYPNPATDILNVSNVSAKTSYKIYNVAGQLVSTGNINNGEVKVNQLAKGMYIISFEDNSKVSNIKFEKK